LERGRGDERESVDVDEFGSRRPSGLGERGGARHVGSGETTRRVYAELAARAAEHRRRDCGALLLRLDLLSSLGVGPLTIQPNLPAARAA
jgi:hypothetical protein